MTDQGNLARRRPVQQGCLVQHLDNRQGRVEELGQRDGLPAARVKWFRGEEEWVVLGYLYSTSVEENE